MNFHRSSISKFHVGIHGVPLGDHPLVSQAVKAVFRLRPPLPQYKSTFDIVPVLNYIRSLPTATVSLHLLSFKALFLTIYSSIYRVSSMARLAPNLEETRDSTILHLLSLEKQSREGRIWGFFQIPRFLKIRNFVLSSRWKLTSPRYKVLILNFSCYSLMSLQVSIIRGDAVTFFISYTKPHKSVTAWTLAGWIKQLLTMAGVDPQIWAPHSVRAATSAHLSVAKRYNLGQICRLADWSMASGVFSKFYQCYV